MNNARFSFLLLTCAALVLTACGGETREGTLSEEEIWGDTVAESPVDESITYLRRSDDVAYGLPRNGKPGIADLIALFPQESLDRTDPSIFSSAALAGAAGACEDWLHNGIADLPMEIEAVVTLHPRQYQKLPICEQDERHYGTYTIEDDTGGIMVLRDSRVAPFSYGDRIKLTVDAFMLTFGRDLDTRAILVAEVEPAEQMRRTNTETGQEEISREIIYSRKSTSFTTDDVGQVKRVEGYVVVAPTNDNFNSMVVADKKYDLPDNDTLQGERLQCVNRCQVSVLGSGCSVSEAINPVCRSLCKPGVERVNEDDLPVCWIVGIDAELGRRGFAPEFGTALKATGPVVHSFDIQMWVLSLGQIEIEDE